MYTRLQPALIFFSLIIAVAAAGQPMQNPVKFRDAVFKEVQVQANVAYKENMPARIKQKYYRFDFYEPAGDSTLQRPLIIWLHGGGFKFGSKKTGGLPLWGKTFAQRGYVCAAINYRLSKKHPLKNFSDLVQGCATAIEDAQVAIRFFKQHGRQYRIDTTRIILGGNSAGGMIGLQAVYSSPAEMARLIHSGDSTSIGLHNPERVAAVINFWGALFDLNWLKNARIPIVSVHGSKDWLVPYDDKKPPMYGSLAIHRSADIAQIPNRVKIYEGYSHELQKHFFPLYAGRAVKKRWLEAGQFAADFLYEQLFLKAP